nr:hypothetical protein CFP56_14288 [Quercus suber]
MSHGESREEVEEVPPLPYVGHSIEECHLLKHKIQSLIDSGALIFEGATYSKVATTTKFDAQGEEVNAIIKEEDGRSNPKDLYRYLDNLFVALMDLGYIHPKELKEQGSTSETCKYHSRAQGHSLEDSDEFNKEVQSLIDKELFSWENQKKLSFVWLLTSSLHLSG